jgi:hypothetical protein
VEEPAVVRVERTLLSAAFDFALAFDLKTLSTAASSTVEERRFSAMESVRNEPGFSPRLCEEPDDFRHYGETEKLARRSFSYGRLLKRALASIVPGSYAHLSPKDTTERTFRFVSNG